MTGKCGRGQTCPYMHDPNRVAICLKFLHSTCPDGDSCDLSHDPTPNRVPACLHFLRGNCSNDDCKYAHVKVNPAAPICHDFAREGYCDKGASCPQRHVWECPDYDEKGICKVKGCKLPHIEHAGRRRLAAAAAAAVATQTGDDATEGEEPDISSDEEEEDEEPFGSDDVDSDFVDDEPFLPGMKQDDDETLAEQQDFVRF